MAPIIRKLCNCMISKYFLVEACKYYRMLILKNEIYNIETSYATITSVKFSPGKRFLSRTAFINSVQPVQNLRFHYFPIRERNRQIQKMKKVRQYRFYNLISFLVFSFIKPDYVTVTHPSNNIYITSSSGYFVSTF